jgi:hypothetical protein
MKELIVDVQVLVHLELERANEQFPMFSSGHEAYGVIKEELEETGEELRLLSSILMHAYWTAVRKNDKAEQRRLLESAKTNAVHCAAEAIQTAAMLQKAMDSMGPV